MDHANIQLLCDASDTSSLSDGNENGEDKLLGFVPLSRAIDIKAQRLL